MRRLRPEFLGFDEIEIVRVPAPDACKLCGGTAGLLSPEGSHYLCEARAKNGAPTPCLGHRCPTCNGSGIKPGFRGGVMLSLDEGPARIARSIAAQFPPCSACKNGVVQ